MIRVIKRYESRKLYDTEESRYVSLDELAGWVREGQEVRVVDNSTSDDVTAQTLAQVILEEGRNGRTKLPVDLMHELVRFGGRALSSGVEQMSSGVDRFVQASIDRLGPVRKARDEMERLKRRLAEIESTLSSLEPQAAGDPESPTGESRPSGPEKRPGGRRTTKKAAAEPRSKSSAGR